MTLHVWSANGVRGALSAVALAGILLSLNTVMAAPPAVATDPAAIAAEQAGHEIAAARAQGRVSVLVYLEEQPGKADTRNSVRAFAQQNQAVVKHEYRSVLPNVINLRNLPEGQIKALLQMPGVTRVELDEYHPNLVNLHDATPLVRGLQSQISAAGFSVDGTGVRVCVADTGIDSDHIMYADRIDSTAGYDFYNNDSNPEDDNGHGSHVSGIAVGGTGLVVDFGCGAGPQDFQGMAPGATLIGVKILNSFGGGFDSDIIAGIDYCADQTASGARADVINLSIGTGAYSGLCTHPWAVAANNAVANGVVVVAASGNENNANAMGSPACGVDVIAVGATYKADYPTCEDNTSNFNWGICIDFSPVEDQVVCFSNESDYLDVTAPGSVIWSASNAAGGSSIVGESGTSMASPMVAGLAALILDADPNLTPAQVRQIIRDGAIDLGPAGFDRAYGWGRIDVINSLALVTPCQNNGDCDDGLFCNGAETCSAGSCQAGTDPCPGQGCDEVSDTCVPLVCNNDGTCSSGEDCNNCPADCISGSTSGAVCGNGVCEAGNGEDCVSCPADCNGVQGGKPSGRFCCGDGDGTNPVGCGDSRCSTGGWMCTNDPVSGGSYCCGDFVCEGAEDSFNCAIDCGAAPYCGDGNCDAGEDECSCPADCGAPPSSEAGLCTDGVDNDCDGNADCNDPDCGADPACQQVDCSQFGDKTSCNAQAQCRWDNRAKVCIPK